MGVNLESCISGAMSAELSLNFWKLFCSLTFLLKNNRKLHENVRAAKKRLGPNDTTISVLSRAVVCLLASRQGLGLLKAIYPALKGDDIDRWNVPYL